MKSRKFSILTLAVVMSFALACKSDKKAEANGADSVANAFSSDTTGLFVEADSSKVGSGAAIINVKPDEALKLPVFSSEDVNQGMAKFEPLRKELEAAVNAKDVAKINELNTRFLDWAKVASTYGAKLPQDENQLYIDTYSSLVMQWDKLLAKK